jgi:hypothetical protein
MEPHDSIAFIGHNPRDDKNNIYIATGDSGNGITHGTIAGILLTDLILGKNNPWTALYDPSRKPGKKPSSNSGDEGQPKSEKEEQPTNKMRKKVHRLKMRQVQYLLKVYRKDKARF